MVSEGKNIHWDLDYQHCTFPRESDTLYQAPSYASSKNQVHHGKSLQRYLNEDIINQEYISIAKTLHTKGIIEGYISEHYPVHGHAAMNTVYRRRTNC